MPDRRNLDPAKAFPFALEALRNQGFLKSARYQEQQTRANRVGAHPLILEFSDKMVKRCAKLGIPVFPLCIVRTEDEQKASYARGVSHDSPDDGLWPHRFAAVDIIHSTLGYMEDENHVPHGWDVLIHIGNEVAHSMGLKVVSGSTFKRLYDPAHWELEGWKEMEPPQ